MEPIVTLYTKPLDPYSVRAKQFLQRKGVAFVEKPLPTHAAEMKQVTGSDRPPQVVINGKPIGSFDALTSLELQGKLDDML
jgi:glutaredoxin 3